MANLMEDPRPDLRIDTFGVQVAFSFVRHNRYEAIEASLLCNERSRSAPEAISDIQ